jgi:rare lipoprotein A
MVERLRAAICGAGIVFLCSSVAMARSEIRSVQFAHGTSIVGAASMYNPYRPGYREGGIETASGERYNPSAWAAAIQTDLRGKFGGIRPGNRASYALVEGTNKRVICQNK